MDQQVEVYKIFRQSQEKYIYFLLSLSVTSVGFVVAITRQVSFTWSYLPLAIAVLSWLVSIYYGLRWNRWNISTLYANHELLRVQSGGHLTELQIPTGYEQLAINGIRDTITKNTRDLMKSYLGNDIEYY